MAGRWLRHGSFTLPAEPVRTLRRGALELVEHCALSGDRRTVLKALDTLSVPISEEGLREIAAEEDDERRAWEEEQLAALAVVEGVARSNDDPFVRLKIWEAVHWQAERGPRTGVRSRARAVLEALPHSFECRFILLMTHHHGHETYRRTWENPADEDEAWLAADEATRLLIEQRRHERDAGFTRQVTHEWVDLHSDPREGFDAIGEWIERIETSGWGDVKWLRRNPFLLRLVADFPSYARAWCEMAPEKPEAPATAKCDDLLCELRRQDPRGTLDLARRFLAHRHPNLALRVAASYSFFGWPQEPLAEDWRIVRELLAFPHPLVKRRAAEILPPIASTNAPRALALVLEAEVGEDSDFADGLYEIFAGRHDLDVESISLEEFEGLLDKLATVDSVRPYRLGRFLVGAALRDPVAVARLLLGRVRHKVRLHREGMNSSDEDKRPTAQRSADAFNGLPESGFHQDDFKEVAGHPAYADALRLIRDAALDDAYQSPLLWEDTLSELFRDFSLNYGPTSLGVLGEWVDSGDCVRVRGALALLGDTYLGFYLTNLPFVSNYLRAAQECGKTVFEEVENTLLKCAQYGPPRAAASHRGERSNRLFRGAIDALQQAGGHDTLTTRFFTQLRNCGQEMIQKEMQQDAEEEVFFRS